MAKIPVPMIRARSTATHAFSGPLASHWAIVCLLLFFAYIRFPFLIQDTLWPDEGFYAWFAYRIFEQPHMLFSPEISAWHPPLFSCVLAWGHLFFEPEIACRFVITLFYLGGIYAIYRLGSLRNISVGLLCAAILGSNENYFNYSRRILLDVPLTVAMTVFAIQLYKKRAGLTALSGCACILTKWTGILTIPWLLLYSLAVRWHILGPSCALIGLMLVLIFKNIIQHNSLLPIGGAVGTDNLYSIHSLSKFLNIFTVHLQIKLTLIFFGIWAVFRMNLKYVLFSWLVVCVGLIFAGANLEVRYLLPLLPPLILLLALGIEFIAQKITSSIFIQRLVFGGIILYTLFLGWQIYQSSRHEALMPSEFKEAGILIQNHADKEALIIALSHRQIRYFSKINYTEYGGQIVPLFKQSREEFKKLVLEHRGKVIVESDSWAPQNTGWFKSFDLNSLGFDLVHTIARPGTQHRIMIWERRGGTLPTY